MHFKMKTHYCKRGLKCAVKNFGNSANFRNCVSFNHTATLQNPIQLTDKECFWLDCFPNCLNNNNNNNKNKGSNIIITNNSTI